MDNIEIAIGEKIKSFRKTREITQEQLAEYLNISFQSVSKWERGEAYPDIIMIPKIALFFNVTTDELLCIDKFKIEQDIDEYFNKVKKLRAVGHCKEAISLLREAIVKYPGNFKFMLELAGVLFVDLCAVPDKEYQINAANEIISIGEKIRADCKDDNIRRDIIQLMVYAYSDDMGIGKKEKARKLIEENLGHMSVSREMLLESVLEGDELIKQKQENLVILLLFLSAQIRSLSRDFEPAEKIKTFENVIKMYSMIFTDGDCKDLSDYYDGIANCHLKLNNIDEALENLSKAAKHTIANDIAPKPFVYTSPLVNKVAFKGGGKNFKGNKSNLMLKNLADENYNPIRDTLEFKAIFEELKKHAKDDL